LIISLFTFNAIIYKKIICHINLAWLYNVYLSLITYKLGLQNKHLFYVLYLHDVFVLWRLSLIDVVIILKCAILYKSILCSIILNLSKVPEKITRFYINIIPIVKIYKGISLFFTIIIKIVVIELWIFYGQISNIWCICSINSELIWFREINIIDITIKIVEQKYTWIC
jgi:hypothetical protein